MLSWAITFLIIGLVAGFLGGSGVAGAATQIAYVLFVVFLIAPSSVSSWAGVLLRKAG